MKIKDIRNGSLYWNNDSQRGERVRSKTNSSSVFTTFHGKGLACVPANRLAMASSSQWQGYLE